MEDEIYTNEVAEMRDNGEHMYGNVGDFKPGTRRDMGVQDQPQGRRKSLCRAAAVCLGLLCFLLLAGIIGLVVLYKVVTAHNHSEMTALQMKNKNLSEEKDFFRNSYNNLTEAVAELQTRYNSLTKERDQLQKEVVQARGQYGWKKFDSTWYYVSTEPKTWEESRKACRQRGADLIVINSKEEQKFAWSLKTPMWIGLTDAEKSRTWKWVDGTPLNTTYWMQGEPNNVKEQCVELLHWQPELGSWNDLACNLSKTFICEEPIKG